ncbi:MAG: hypothetical protein HC913_17415 [Microscillaceae bacterium]|nr:hypothetical protein [Microscillaceae bacterium]
MEEPSSPLLEKTQPEADVPLPLTDTFLREFVEYFIKTKPGDNQLFKILKRIPKAKGPDEVLLELEAEASRNLSPISKTSFNYCRRKPEIRRSN